VKYLPFSVADASLITGTSTMEMVSGGIDALPAD
jgi:hypothetical protein